MSFKFFTDERALIRADFKGDELLSMFATLGKDGTWHESPRLVPSPYHAVECDRDTARKAAVRIAGSEVDLDAPAEPPPN